MALQAAAEELYGLPPEQFTAARDDFAARLRKAGERELAAAVRELRRPSVAAWLVNLLVRRRRTELDDLLETGAQLRSAMTGGAGSDVRRLTEDRRTAVAVLTGEAEALAERRVSPGVLDEVRATLEAATADSTAATAVRSGRLVRALRYAGFGELPDLAGAVGLAPASAAPAEPAGRRTKRTTEAKAAARQKAERAAQEAAGAADDTQRAYEQRLTEHADAEARVVAATGAVRAAAAQLASAEDAKKSAAVATTRAREAARAAHAAADAARGRLAGVRAEPTAKRRQ